MFAQVSALLAQWKTKTTGCVSLLLTQGTCYLLAPNIEEMMQFDYADWQQFSEKVRALWKKHHWPKYKIDIVMSAPLYKKFSLEKPDVPESEILQTLPWAAKDFVSQPVSELVFDYIDLPTPAASKSRIQVYTIERQLMKLLARLFNELGLLQTVMPDETTWLDLLTPMAPGQLLIYKRLAEDLELLAIFSESICFSRQFRGTAGLGEDQRPLSDLEIEEMSVEIQRAMDYITSQLKLPDIKKIYLALHLADIEEISTRLKEFLAVETCILHDELTGSDPNQLLLLSHYRRMIAHEKTH